MDEHARPGRRLREALQDPGRFTTIVELAPWRGPLAASGADRARSTARALRDDPRVDAVSLTDGAGGRLAASPEALARELLAEGSEVMVHVTCRDRNRNELASLGWRLQDAGVGTVLVLTGDYPCDGSRGVAKPVFDLDSVGLLELYATQGRGTLGASVRARPTSRDRARAPAPSAPARWQVPAAGDGLFLGTAVDPYKRLEAELVPQYEKLALKARAGACFAITQIGFDAHRLVDVADFVAERALDLRLVAGVSLLSLRAARALHRGAVPGVQMSDGLLARVEREASGADGGREFFLSLAAAQVAVAARLGYAGAYLSGGTSGEDYVGILDRLEDRVRGETGDLLEEVSWPLAPASSFSPGAVASPAAGRWGDPASGRVGDPHGALVYRASRAVNWLAFAPRTRRRDAVAGVVAAMERSGLGHVLHVAEQAVKVPLYGCRDCGDCSLEEIAYLCPESQCVKNQRNGPCGGSRDGECEVPGRACIWARAYERLRPYGAASRMLDRPPTVQDNALRRTSGWANYLLGRDHAGPSGDGASPIPGT